MPACVVKSCRNHTSFVKKEHGITFHRFPREEVWRIDWIRIIRESRNENDWNPSKSSVACSEHFAAKDLYATKGGLRRVVKFAVPTKVLNEPTSIQEKCAPETGISSALLVVDSDLQDSSSSIEEITGDQQTLDQSCFQNLNSTLPELPKVQEKQANEADIFCSSHNLHQPSLEQACSQNPNSSLTRSSPNAVSPPDDIDREQTLSLLHRPRKPCVKKNLRKTHMLTQSSKSKIKVLKQKVRRLQNRNKRLINILKTLKKRIILI